VHSGVCAYESVCLWVCAALMLGGVVGAWPNQGYRLDIAKVCVHCCLDVRHCCAGRCDAADSLEALEVEHGR